MRKISWLAILLIGGCTPMLEQSNLVSLNDSSEFRFLDEQVFIRSCRQLKEESYDIFYAGKIKNVWKRMPSKCKNCPNRLSRRMI